MILGGAGLILLTKERTDRQLELAATRDALTGALNRRSFDEALAHALAVATRHDFPCALVMFDFDDFKTINDSRGHAVGDAVLRDFAAAMERATGNNASANTSRIGFAGTGMRLHRETAMPTGLCYGCAGL